MGDRKPWARVGRHARLESRLRILSLRLRCSSARLQGVGRASSCLSQCSLEALSRQRAWVTVGPPVEEDPCHPCEVDEPEIVLAAEGGDGLLLLVAQVVSGRHPGVDHEDRPGAATDRRGQSVEVKPPFAALGMERHEARNSPDDAHPIDHHRVRRVGENDLVLLVYEIAVCSVLWCILAPHGLDYRLSACRKDDAALNDHRGVSITDVEGHPATRPPGGPWP
jgi:hypothetical protein